MDPDPTKVDIIFLRHGQSNSNICLSDSSGEPHMTEDLWDQVKGDAVGQGGGGPFHLSCGEWIPDGLTSSGIEQTHDMAKDLKKDPMLRNLHTIVASPATRALQTGLIVSEYFANVPVKCHTGFLETTNWPHDRPPQEVELGEKRFRHYVALSGGGKGLQSGLVDGIHEVNTTKVHYENGIDLDSHDPAQHKKKVVQARRWLRDLAREARLDALKAQKERPVILVIIHGGVLNLILDEWLCDISYDQNIGKYVLNSSTTLRNLAVLVLRFKSADDEEADLEDIPMAEGDRLPGLRQTISECRSSSGIGPAHKFDPSRLYWEFVERVRGEVAMMHREQSGLMKKLEAWE